MLIHKLYGTVLLQRCSVLLSPLCQSLLSGTGLVHGVHQKEDGIIKYHSQLICQILDLTLLMSIKEEVAETTTQSKPVDGISVEDTVVQVAQLQSSKDQEEPIPKDVVGGDVESSRLQEDVISVNSTTTWDHEVPLRTELFFILNLISAKTQKLSVNQNHLQLLSGLLVSSIG